MMAKTIKRISKVFQVNGHVNLFAALNLYFLMFLSFLFFVSKNVSKKNFPLTHNCKLSLLKKAKKRVLKKNK